MPRAGTVLGSLRSLFKVSRKGSHRTEDALPSGIADAALTIEPALACGQSGEPPTPVADAVSISKGGPKPALAPDTLSKAVHRKLFSRSFLPARSPLSTTQSAICHSLSEPFEDPSKVKSSDGLREAGSSHACGTEGVRFPAKASRLLAVRDADSPMLSSPDITPSATYDNSRRCLSLDIPAAALTSPAAVGKSQRLLLPVVLASASATVHTRSGKQSSPPTCCSFDAAAAESPQPATAAAVPPPPSTPSSVTTLLALCPGTPSAMRRRHWCVEDYEVTRKIYKGATSTVYKAMCRHSGLPVALKVYFLSKVPMNVMHMIIREIKIHVGLVHKHAVMLYAAFQDEKRLVLVQEYAGRGDLYGIYRSLNRRMTEAQLTHLVLAPFMEALSHLHSRGICHRDIKPENILFTSDWRLLIADFGVSIDLNQERAVTRAGTLEYMAPEVERCPLKMLPEDNKENIDLAYTTAVDIWAIGVLAYELLVGFPPFVGAERAVGAAASEACRAPGSGVRPKLCFPSSTSPLARDFISQALAERSEERPTAKQLLQHTWLAAAVQQLHL